jgi:hypothetical protein
LSSSALANPARHLAQIVDCRRGFKNQAGKSLFYRQKHDVGRIRAFPFLERRHLLPRQCLANSAIGISKTFLPPAKPEKDFFRVVSPISISVIPYFS